MPAKDMFVRCDDTKLTKTKKDAINLHIWNILSIETVERNINGENEWNDAGGRRWLCNLNTFKNWRINFLRKFSSLDFIRSFCIVCIPKLIYQNCLMSSEGKYFAA